MLGSQETIKIAVSPFSSLTSASTDFRIFYILNGVLFLHVLVYNLCGGAVLTPSFTQPKHFQLLTLTSATGCKVLLALLPVWQTPSMTSRGLLQQLLSLPNRPTCFWGFRLFVLQFTQGVTRKPTLAWNCHTPILLPQPAEYVESRGELGTQMCITPVLIHSPRTDLPFRLTSCSSWSQAWTHLVNWVDRSHAHGQAHFTQDCHPQQLLSPKCQLCQSSECTHGVCTHGHVYTYAHTFTQSSVYIKARVLMDTFRLNLIPHTGFTLPPGTHSHSCYCLSDKRKLGSYYPQYTYLFPQFQNVHKLVSDLLTQQLWKINVLIRV